MKNTILFFCLLALASLQFSSCQKDCLANDYVGGFVGDTFVSTILASDDDNYIFSPSADNKKEVTINSPQLQNVKATITKTNACQIDEGQTNSNDEAISGSFSLDEAGTQLSGSFTIGTYTYTVIANKQ